MTSRLHTPGVLNFLTSAHHLDQSSQQCLYTDKALFLLRLGVLQPETPRLRIIGVSGFVKPDGEQVDGVG